MRLLIILFLGLTSSIFAQSSNVRQKHPLTLLVDETADYKMEVPVSPFIIGDSLVQVYPGEKLFIEVDLIKGKFKNLKIVRAIQNKEKTLVVEFSQISNGQLHKQMKLSFFNPFNKELNYSANIYLMQHSTWTQTSVIPVGAGKTSFEFWPDIISTITLSDFKLTK
jgi:hypothetical protein